MSNGILQPDTPIKFQARNHRPVYKRLRAGDFYGGNLEYERETWDVMQTIPDGAILEVILYYHMGDPTPEQEAIEKAEEKTAKPKRERKPPKETGPHGKYWEAMFKHGALNSPDVKTVLETEQDREIDDVKAALKLMFAVDSLTFISPIDFEQWCGKYNLASLITISRNAAAEAGV